MDLPKEKRDGKNIKKGKRTCRRLLKYNYKKKFYLLPPEVFEYN